MFASRRKAEPNGHDPAAIIEMPIAPTGEVSAPLPAPPAMLDGMAKRLLGVTFADLQKIGAEVGDFIREAKLRVENIERQNLEILALLKKDRAP